MKAMVDGGQLTEREVGQLREQVRARSSPSERCGAETCGEGRGGRGGTFFAASSRSAASRALSCWSWVVRQPVMGGKKRTGGEGGGGWGLRTPSRAPLSPRSPAFVQHVTLVLRRGTYL
jgi:hypothetical protein